MIRKRSWTILAGAAALVLAVTPVLAQDEAEPAEPLEATVIEVIGVEYAFDGLPESVPADTTLTFSNDGIELHEIVVNRVADGVAETFEELMALNESGVDLEAEGYIDTDFGDPMLLAMPGQLADGEIKLEQAGRYVALCFIPTGMDPAALEEFGVDITTLGPDTDMEELPAEAQAYLEELMTNAVPHIAQGMIQEFTVTAVEGDMEDEA